MKKAMIHYKKNPILDMYHTPREAITPLLQHIPYSATIWEPTDPGNSQITRIFQDRGNTVITSDLSKGQNFFDYTPEESYDIIITNPPYSLKTEFLHRVYSLGKPFAFLLPLTTLEGVERGKIFREYSVELLVFDRRVEFMNEKPTNWFNSSWFCWNLLPKQIIFSSLKRRP